MEYDCSRWLYMFETACARYRCRPIEAISSTDEDLWLNGPDGQWLTEITSVQFNDVGALTTSSLTALSRLAKNVLLEVNNHGGCSTSRPDYTTERVEIAIDWFLTCTRSRADERRQCLVKVCRNERMLTVMLLANVVQYGQLEPCSLAFSRYPDRLRPFVFVLACELFHRRLNFEILNLHYEPLSSSTRWRTGQREQWLRLQHHNDDDVPPSDRDAVNINADRMFTSDGRGDGWLELMREMHSRGRWLRIYRARPEHELLDAMITSRSANGRIRYLWRDGRFMRSSYGLNAVAHGTLVSLRDLDTEIRRARSCVLTLCDYSIFNARAGHFLLFRHNTFDSPIGAQLSTAIDDTVATDVIDDQNSNNDVCAWATCTIANIRGKQRQETLREKRYFINHAGNLVSRPFVSFSS